MKSNVNFWMSFVDFASFEWLMSPRLPNGGAAVLARTLCISIEFLALTIALWNWIDPERTGCPSWLELRKQLIHLAPVFAAATGAIYVALYARFTSQWNYLASLYNQIKESEILMPRNSASRKRMAEWKAGYIEDAKELHLHTKPIIAGIIYFWSQQEGVKEAFIAGVHNGECRWKALQEDVSLARLISKAPS